MHAIKGGWVGQTFALAKCNESGGKKSRIRRSKEERKALVVSFIKKYQKLNNGIFPSLSLTHKEVGGSFYTVRELVREAIQENRVLGPAKLTSEDQNQDGFLEQSPLGSILIEPEAGLSSSNGSQIVTHLVSTPQQDEVEELVLDSSVHCPESEYQRFDEGKSINEYSQLVKEDEEYVKAIDTESRPTETLESKAKVTHPHKGTSEELVSQHQKFDEGEKINGSSQIVERTKEYDEASYTESLPTETLQLDENVAELEVSKGGEAHVATEVMVEKFPLRSGTKVTYGLNEKYCEHSDLTQALVQEEIGRVEPVEVNNSSVVVDMNLSESTSDLRNEKVAENIVGPLLETLQLDENVAELEVSKGGEAHVATEVMVEKFPLRSGTKVTYGLDEKYSEHSDLTQALVQEEIGRVELAEVNNSSVVVDMNVSESTSDLRNEKAVDNIAGPLLENSCNLVDEKPVGNLEAPVLENLNNSTTREGAILETRNDRNPEVKDVSHAETEVVIDAPVCMDTQSLNGTIGSNSSEQSISEKVADKSNPNRKLNVKNGSISPKGSNLTLDRMNLESWETSEKPGEPKTNPLLLFIKSSIEAFVKFWSQ